MSIPHPSWMVGMRGQLIQYPPVGPASLSLLLSEHADMQTSTSLSILFKWICLPRTNIFSPWPWLEMKRLSPQTVLWSLAFHSSCWALTLVRAQPRLWFIQLSQAPVGFGVWNNKTGLSITPPLRSPWTHWERRRGGWQRRLPQGSCPESICHIDRMCTAGVGWGGWRLFISPKPTL